MPNIATHDGRVIKTEPDKVTVEMHVVSACSSCAAHEKCAFVDKDDKVVEVATSDWKDYEVGDSVIVSVNQSRGLTAVLLAYLLPAVLLVAGVVAIIYATGSEGLAAIVSILIVVAYYVVLYALRDRLQQRFTFGIRKA